MNAFTNGEIDRHGNPAGARVPISTNEAPADGRIEDGDIVIAVVFVSRGAARLRDVIWRPS